MVDKTNPESSDSIAQKASEELFLRGSENDEILRKKADEDGLILDDSEEELSLQNIQRGSEQLEHPNKGVKDKGAGAVRGEELEVKSEPFEQSIQIDEIESIATDHINNKNSSQIKSSDNNDQEARRAFLNLDEKGNGVIDSQLSFNSSEVPPVVVNDRVTVVQEDDGGSNDDDIIILATEEDKELPVVEKEFEETINTAPNAGNDVALDVNEGAAIIKGELMATDADQDAVLSYQVVDGITTPDGFVLSSDGNWQFDAQASTYNHLNVGDLVVLTVPIVVIDEHGASDAAQIQITVTGTNDVPIAGASVVNSVNEGSASISGQLTSADADDGATATYTISSGITAPDGFVLNTDGSYSFNPADSAYDHLNVGDSEVLTIPVTVTDDNGASDTSQIQITVSGTNDAPVAGASVSASVDEGAPSISGQLTSTDLDDGATATFTVSAGSTAPDGFVISNDGSYSFDPTDGSYDHLNVGDSEVITVPVTVTDDQGATDTSQIQITVSGTNDAPIAGASVSASVDEGDTSISGQLTSTDLDDGATATFTVSSGNTAPDGFVLNTDGSYSFDPADSAYEHLNAGDSEVVTVPVTVTDDNGATDTSQIQITVSGTNDAPIAGAAVTANVDEGDAVINGQLTSSDVDDGATATYSISAGSTAPDGFVINNDGSYSFDPADASYNHLNVGDSEVITIPVTVTDDQGGADTSQIQITVSGTNDAPVAGASVSALVGEGLASISGQLTSTDLDDGATASFTISSGNTAPDGFVINSDGSYSFDPTDASYDHLNVGDSEVLTIPVTVTDDNGATDTSQIQITVSGTNDAPIAGASVSASVDEGDGVINGQLTSSDADDSATATFIVSSGNTAPDGFVLNTDGSYLFDPDDASYNHLNVGDSEVITIPITVTDDQGASDTSQIQITVSGTNDAPVAGASISASVDEGATSISGQLTSTDLDDGATATFTVSSGSTAPDGFVLNNDGSYSFDPTDGSYDHLNVGDSEVITVPVTVTDDQGATDTSQIQITVSGTNDAPIAGASVSALVDEGAAAISGQLTSTDMDDGATATFTVSSGSTAPDGFVLNTDGSYSFDPADASYDHLNVGDSEVLTVPVTVTDDNGATDTSQVQITVSGTNDAPVAGASVSASVDEGATSISGQLTSTDLDDGATAAFTVSSGNTVPDGFVLNTDGSYSFDPADASYNHLNVGDSEVITIPITVTDDNGAMDTSQIQITVSGTNDAPVAGTSVSANVDEGTAVINGQLTSADVDDGASAVYTVSAGSTAPDSFVLNADGSYSFDPADSAYDHFNVGDSEVLTIPVTVTDDQGATDTSQIQITVSGTNDVPVAGAAVTTNVDEGSVSISGQLISTDIDDGATATFTISSGSTAPDGFVLNADGSYSFDPADTSYNHLNVGDSEVLTIPVTVTDDNRATDTSQIQITVSGTNDAPVAGASVSASVDEGDAVINGQLTSSDADDSATATYSISSGSTAPDGFVINSDGLYSFDPTDGSYDHLNVGDSEVLTIPVTVTDDQGATDTSQIQITISGTNDAPVAGAAVTANVDEGSPQISGQLTSTDLDDVSTATFTVSSGSTAPDGFVINADGSYSFDPADSAYDHLNAGDSEVLTIPITVTDNNGATDTSQIQITVSGTNDAPVAGTSVRASVDEGSAVISGQLTSTDVDAGATAIFAVSAGSAAPDGFVINADGSYSFDPADSTYDHLNVGDSEVITIPVTVTDDNGAIDTSQIQITVSGTNDAPIAGAAVTANVDEGDAVINGQLTSGDVDDGATATYSISSGSTAPDGFVINADGSYSFDPADGSYDHLNVGDSEVITVPVMVTDDQGATDTSQVQITVSGTNDSPVAGVAVTANVDEGAATISGQLTSTDLDDGATASWSVSAGNTAPDGFVINADGSYSLDPTDASYEHLNVGDSEVLTIPVTVTDDNGATDTSQIQITISGTNDAPVAGAFVSALMDEGSSSISGQLTSTDLDDGATATYTVSAGSTAPDGFIINTDGSYSFDPADSAYEHLNVGDSEVVAIPVTVTDDQGATDTSQIQITISGTNDAPVAGATVTANVNEGSSAIGGQLSSTDLDDGTTATFTISSGNTAPDGFVLNTDGSYSFDPADSTYDHLNVGDSEVLTIPIIVTDDQGATDTSQIQITISGTNDAPVAGVAVTATVDDGSATILGQLMSTDVDDGATATFAISSGNTAPDGFVLNTDGSYSFDPAGTAYDHLNVGDSEVVTIPVTVTDDQGATDTSQIQITISGTNDAPVAGVAVTATVDEGSATILGQLMSTDIDDGATATFTVSSGNTAPDGFVLNVDGSYSFDPMDSSYDHLTVGDSEVLTIPVTVTDDNGATDTSQIQVTVSGTNDAPVAGAAVTANVDEGTAVISGQLTSTDVDNGATAGWSVSAGSTAPDGFVINADGSYSFDPADTAYDHLNVGDSEVVTIPVTVTDDNGATDTSQIQITISGTNDSPVAGVAVTANIDEGSTVISGQLTSTDVDDGATVTFTISSGSTAPDGFVINADGSYSFDPTDSSYDHLNVGDSEVLTIPVTVTDNNGATDTSQIQITISGTNDAPVAGVAVTASVDEGSAAISSQLTSTDVDAGVPAIFSVSAGSAAPDGFVINADGSYSFDPADSAYDHLNVGDSEVLTIPVTITDDKGATDTSQIQITVSGTNDTPIAGASVSANVDEGDAVINGQLTSSDTDDSAAATWSVSSGLTAPDGFVIRSDGLYSFDPTDGSYDHLNVGDSEVLTVPVTVTDDNGATDTSQIQITVSGTNDAPIAGASVSASVDEGAATISGQLTSTDLDDETTVTFTISSSNTAPDGFVLNTDGSYSFDPADSSYDHLNVGDSEVLTIPVTVTDDNGATDTSQIQITVSGTNDAPVAGASVSALVDEGSAAISGQLTSTDLDDGATSTFIVSSGSTAPDGFVLNTDGSYSFDPADASYDHLNVGDSEVLTVPVTVTDDNGATDTSQIQITVSGTNDAPVAGASVSALVDEGSASISGQLTSTDLDDGATAAFTVSSGNTGPDGFVLNTDGSYSFDPADASYDHLNVGDSEVITVPVTVTDDNGATDTSQIQITVSGTNDAPVAGAVVTANVDEGSSSISGQLTSTDLDDGATATFTVSSGSTAPEGFVINADGSYSFDPADASYDHLNVGDSEVITVPVTVTDDNGETDTSQIQITVSGTNDAPVAGTSVSTSVDEGATSISGQLTSTDLDDGATATFTVSSGSTAPDGFIIDSDGSYSFDPADASYNHLNVGDSEVITIPVTVTDDNGAMDTSQIQITVSGTNDAPVAGAAVTANVDEGSSSISGQLTSTDLDDGATSTFTVSSGSTAPDGFVISNDGSYSFDPADASYNHLNVGDSEVITVPVTVTDDNGATDTSQIQITVSGTNDAPVAGASVSASVDEGDISISGQLTSTDLDDGATAAFTVSSGNTAPDGFVLNADGSYSFDPADASYNHLNVGDSEVLTIPVTVTDDNGATDTSQIQITVSGTNDVPVAGASVSASVDEGASSISGQLTSTDLDDGATASFTVSSGSTAPDGFIIDSDGSYSFDPADASYNHLNVGDSEVITIPVTVTDDNGATDTSQIQITVSGTNDAPIAGAAVTANVDEGDAVINGQLTSSDVDDGATATYSISAGSTAPDGFVINADGSYLFDPTDGSYDHLNVGDSEVITVPVTVTDDNGATDTSQIQITVSGTNDVPVAGAAVTANVDEGSASISGRLTSTDLDDGATATFTVSTGSTVPDGFIINTDGSYTFDPEDSAYDHLNVGDSEVITIPVTVADDQGATDTSQIQITVSGTNDAPVAGVSVSANIDEGDTSISGQLTSIDLDDGATASFTVSAGSTAPDGFVLNTDGSYSFDPVDSAYEHLNAGDSEVVTIPVTVTDDQGATDTSQIQITVSGTNDAPVAGASVSASVDEGDAVINGQLTSSDTDDSATATFIVSSGNTAPDGFVLNTDGSYSFDPADASYNNLNVGDSEVVTIPVTVTDDNGATDTSQIQITVSGTNDAPVAGASVSASVDEGDTSISGQITSTDLDNGATANWSVSSGSTAPNGFVINNDGSYSFDPTGGSYDHLNVGDSEVLTIPVTVTDDQGETDTSQIQITVSGTNDAPIAGASISASVDEGAAVISGQLTSTDLDDGATATFTVSSGSTAPDGFVINNDGSYSFDPADASYDHLNVGDSEVLTIPVTVTDDNGATDTSQIQITVSGTNDTPVAGASVSASVDEGDTSISSQLTSTDLDDGATSTFTVSSGSTAPDGFVLNTDGSYSFDPADSAYEHLNAGDSEVLTIPVTVTDDNGATDTSQIQITVSGTNDAPVAGASVSANVDEGDAVINGQLTSSDADDSATATWSVSAGSTAPDGFVINADGSYSFDPADGSYEHLNVGDSEVITVPVTVTDDNGVTDTSQIQIKVSGTNDAPVAGASVSASVDEGATSISGQLTSTDLDDGATATFTVSSGSTAPDGFVLNNDGSYSFDPTDGSYDHLNVVDSEVITVPVTVTDDNGATDTSQIQITVSGTNDAPVAGASVSANVDEGDAVINGQLTSSDADDSATATWSVSAGSTAPDGFVINNDGSYSFDPTDGSYDHLNVGDSEVITIPVTVTDDNGAMDVSQIQITVSGTNDAPIAGASVNASVDEGAAAISGQLTSTDLDDGATSTFTVSSGSTAPEGFVINADGSYSFDPSDSAYDHLNVGDSEVLTVPVTVTDDNGATDTSQIQITVSGTNDAPVAGAAVTANVDEGSSSISGQLTSTDLDDGATSTFTVSSGSTAPDGFVISNDGSYSFDPADASYNHLNVGDSEVITVPVTVTDDNGATDTSQIQITVSGTNDAPVAGASVSASVDEGDTSISGQLTSTDLDDGATATFTVSSGATAPGGFVLNTDGSYSFDPTDASYDHLNVGDSEVLTIPVTVTDESGATDTSQIQVTVSGTNDAPVAGASVSASVDKGATSISGQLTSTDLDDGATATFTISSGTTAPDGFVLNADGSYSFDPADSAYDHLSVGDTEVITVPVTVTDDNGATDTTQVQITVSGSNNVPTATDDSLTSVTEGTVLVSETFTSNSTWGDNVSNGELILTKTDTSADTTLDFGVDNAGNTVSISFDAQALGSWDNSGSNEDTFNINGEEITLDRGAASQTFTVEAVVDSNGHVDIVFDGVISGSDESVIVDNLSISAVGNNWTSALETSEDQPLTINAATLLSNDTDADGDSLSIISVQGAQNGSVSLDADGNVLFTPAANYSGEASFTYTISDGQGGTDTATATLTINDIDDEASTPVVTLNVGDVSTIVGQVSAMTPDTAETAGATNYGNASGNNEIEIDGNADNVIVAGEGWEKIEVENGNDQLTIGDALNDSSKSEIKTDKGDDVVSAGNNWDKVDLGDGNDHLTIGNAGAGNNDGKAEIKAGKGEDVVSAGNNWDKIDLGDGNDFLTVGNAGAGDKKGKAEIKGGKGDDVIVAGDDWDKIDLGDGNDILIAGDADVTSDGTKNEIKAGKGDDNIQIGDNWEKVDGGDGNDTLYLNGQESDYSVSMSDGKTFYSKDGNTLEVKNVESVQFGDYDDNSGVLTSLSDSYEYSLDISASLTDLDNSESISSIVVTGLPDTADLNAGTDNGDGTWSLTADQLGGLSLTVPDTETNEFSLSVSVTSTESNGGDTSTTTLTTGITPGANAGPQTITFEGGSGNDSFSGAGNDVTAYGNEGNDTYVANPFDGADSFSGGEGGGWTDVIDVSAVAANDPDSPWAVEVDGVQMEYDIAAGALELNPDTAGVITFGDGSELSFDGVERIEW